MFLISAAVYFIGMLVTIAFEARFYRGDIDAYTADFTDSPLPFFRILFWPVVLAVGMLLIPFRLAWRLGSPRPPKPALADVDYRTPPKEMTE